MAKKSVMELVRKKTLPARSFAMNWGFSKDLTGQTVEEVIHADSRQIKTLYGAPEKVVSNCFDVSYNSLTSLEFSPQEVTGNYICHHNKLITLKDGPKIVGGFNCSENLLTNLEGAPEKVEKCFVCRNNNLTSLKGAPKEVGGDFDCRGNNLESIEGLPEKIGGVFIADKEVIIKFGREILVKGIKIYGELKYYASDAYLNGTEYSFAEWYGEDLTGQTYEGNLYCGGCHLTSLKGAPKEITGYFDCSNNELISLEGCPETTGDNFMCNDNKLITLEGGPKEIGGTRYDCQNNRLTSLKGAPEKLEGKFHTYIDSFTGEEKEGRYHCEFNCTNNKLTSLEGSPKYVDGGFRCGYNPLTSLKGAPERITKWFSIFYDRRDGGNVLTSLKGGPKYVGDHYDIGSALVITEGFDEGVIIGRMLSISLKSIDHIYETIPDGCEVEAYKQFNSWHNSVDVTEEVREMKNTSYETIK